MSFFSNKPKEPKSFIIKGKPLVCGHCRNETFYEKTALIRFGLSIMNNTAACFICSQCSHVMWFREYKPG